MARMGDRLNQARRRRFVGRNAELELFRTVLGRDVPDFAVLHLHGPGGVGKTALLREFARLAEAVGRPCLSLDCRHLDPSPMGFLTAVQLALDLPSDVAPWHVLAAHDDLVLFLDTYELAAPLDGWLRDEFLPHLADRALVVTAGRRPPSVAWRSDGWDGLTRIVALRNLQPDESRTLLRDQGLLEEEIGHVLAVTYGHPLALSLAADLYRQTQAGSVFALRQDPDMVRVLLERFVADVPDPVMRQALEVCAHALNTDEALLAHCLGEEHAYTAFQWLRNLSFIEQGPFGLFPHDLAREVLEADLRWRNLERFRALHFQVRDHIIQQIRTRSGPSQQHAIFALIFLHRNNPFMRPFYEWQSFGQYFIEPAQPADMPVIEEIVRRHQGPESLAATRYWASRPECSFYLFRASADVVVGFCQVVDISNLSDEAMAADPAMRAAADQLRSVSPRRADGVILYFRNWMDATNYQDSPAIFNMAAMVSLRLYFNTPALSYSLIAHSNADQVALMFEYLRTPRARRADFSMDGQAFGVFVHDWQAEPVLDWLSIMGERELLDEIVALEQLPVNEQPVVLSEPEFAEAVRQALRDVRRPDLLAQSPLLRSRCLREYSNGAAGPATLQALLRAGADILTAAPRTQRLHRVLHHTYFEPAPTQEAAAELLDLPFSTYRYQLGKAVEQLTAWLWQRELYGVETPAAAPR